jgi:predicted RNA-binding Zn-ribbon protein involved in translation (DUF1610 family)
MAALFPGIQRKAQLNTLTEKDLELFKEPSAFKLHVPQEETCSSCNAQVETDNSEEIIVCGQCGEVLERILDAGAEYRFFGYDDRSSIDPCRVGAPIDKRFPASTLGTIILTRIGNTHWCFLAQRC